MASVRSVALLFLFQLLSTFGEEPSWIPDEKGATGAPPGNFSIYLLRQQWAPEWCCREPWHGWCPPIVTKPYRERLILHGLWPEYDDKRSNRTGHDISWPQWCGKFKDCKSDLVTVGLPKHCSIPQSDRNKYDAEWAVLAPAYPFNKEDLGHGWNCGDHEYAKHGTCTVLNSTVFLGEGIRLMSVMGTPRVVQENIGKRIRLADLQRAYNFEGSRGKEKAAAFSCTETDGRVTNFFSVTTCWSVDGGTGKPDKRIDCPGIVTRNEYSNNCIKAERVHIKGAIPGKCRAVTTKASGLYVFYICSALFGIVLLLAICARVIQQLCGMDELKEEDKLGTAYRKMYRSK